MIKSALTDMSFNTASGKYYCNKGKSAKFKGFNGLERFNTASGKYYCNSRISVVGMFIEEHVSIPQAVSTIAIKMEGGAVSRQLQVSIPQAVSTIAIVKQVLSTVVYV